MIKTELRRKPVRALADVVANLIQITTFLKNNYLEREDNIRQLILAVITRQHVLFVGAPGSAKSRLVVSFMSCFEGMNTFRKQLSRYLPEEAIIGSLNPKLLREQGIYEYNTDGTLVDAHLAYLDEVFDGNDSTLRSMLEILNERQFTKGHQKLECPLVSCFMASNFHRDDKNVEAFVDRILFRSQLCFITEKANKVKMVQNFIGKDTTPEYDGEKLTLADLEVVHEALNSITMTEELIELFISFSGELCMKLSQQISDRKLNQLTYVLKASALLNKRDSVSFDDFVNLKYGFLVLGNKHEEEDEFEKLLAQYSKNVVGLDETVGKLEKKAETLLKGINLKKPDHNKLKQDVEDLKLLYDTIEKGESDLKANSSRGSKTEEALKKFASIKERIDHTVDKILEIVK